MPIESHHSLNFGNCRVGQASGRAKARTKPTEWLEAYDQEPGTIHLQYVDFRQYLKEDLGRTVWKSRCLVRVRKA